MNLLVLFKIKRNLKAKLVEEIHKLYSIIRGEKI